MVEEVHEAEVPHFRSQISKRYEEVHIVNRLFLEPVVRAARGTAYFLARMHNGRINSYVAYVLVTLAVFILIALIFP